MSFTPDASRIFSALDNLPFYNGRVFTEALSVATDKIKEMWDEGVLPHKIDHRKQWIVGYRVKHSMFGHGAFPIIVGPKKPSRFRDKYVAVDVLKPQSQF